MQFSKDLAQKIMNGHKTQTRRPVKQGEQIIWWDDEKNAVIMESGRLKWLEGRTYTVQPGRGKKGIGRMTVHSIDDQPLQTITEEDAINEGFEGIEDFKAKWMALYPTGPYAWDKNPSVWVLHFGDVTKD